MERTNDRKAFTATDMRIALSEIYHDSSYGAVPVIDQYDALKAYRAYDDGRLSEAPSALVSYIAHHQQLHS